MNTTGNRIKIFRQRAKVSQMDLEVAIGASPGSLSRIESGKVVPTRQTVLKIVDYLGLNFLESNYLDGTLTYPANLEDLEKVKSHLKEYFSKKETIAYISDDRFRLIYASDTLRKILGISDTEASKIYNKSIISVILDPKLGVRKFIENDGFEELVKFQLSIFYAEMGFMKDDDYYFEAINAISNDQFAEQIFNSIKEKNEIISNREGRKVSFNIANTQISLDYSTQHIQKYPRFILVEYSPTKEVLDYIEKFIK